MVTIKIPSTLSSSFFIQWENSLCCSLSMNCLICFTQCPTVYSCVTDDCPQSGLWHQVEGPSSFCCHGNHYHLVWLHRCLSTFLGLRSTGPFNSIKYFLVPTISVLSISCFLSNLGFPPKLRTYCSILLGGIPVSLCKQSSFVWNESTWSARSNMWIMILSLESFVKLLFIDPDGVLDSCKNLLTM